MERRCDRDLLPLPFLHPPLVSLARGAPWQLRKMRKLRAVIRCSNAAMKSFGASMSWGDKATQQDQQMAQATLARLRR
eukprot:2314880-Amphidinium_carterae.2